MSKYTIIFTCLFCLSFGWMSAQSEYEIDYDVYGDGYPHLTFSGGIAATPDSGMIFFLGSYVDLPNIFPVFQYRLYHLDKHGQPVIAHKAIRLPNPYQYQLEPYQIIPNQIPVGGYYAGGRAQAGAGGYADYVVARLSPGLTIHAWGIDLYTPGFTGSFANMDQAPNDDLLVLGKLHPNSGNDLLNLCRIDTSGIVLWNQTLTASASLEPGDVEVLPWGDILLCGQLPGSDGYLAKFTSAGQLIWSQRIPGFHPQHIARTNNGNLYLSGVEPTIPGFGTQSLAQIDTTGAVLWSKKFTPPNPTPGSIDQHTDLMIIGGDSLFLTGENISIFTDGAGNIVDASEWTGDQGITLADGGVALFNPFTFSSHAENASVSRATSPTARPCNLTPSVTVTPQNLSLTPVTHSITLSSTLQDSLLFFPGYQNDSLLHETTCNPNCTLTPGFTLTADSFHISDPITLTEQSSGGTSFAWSIHDYNPAPMNTPVGWSTLQQPPPVLAPDTGMQIIRQTVSNATCARSFVDTVITYNTIEIVSMSSTSSICDGDLLQVIPTILNNRGPITYNWFVNGVPTATAANPIFNLPGPGTYSIRLEVMDAFFSDVDSFSIVVNALPTVNLGPDTAACQFGQITLQAPTGYPSYLWNTGGTLSSITVFSAGTFWVEVVDQNGCANSDTILVDFNPLPVFSLGPDTVACNNDTVLLEGPVGNYNYIWSVGSIAPTIEVTLDGWYILVVEDTNSCSDEDSIYVTFEDCVWPGDADNDGVANNNDLLSIGLGFGTLGPSRANASNLWIGQTSTDWNDTLPSGINMKYPDCNGDGIVNDNDTLAINLNYGQTHNKTFETSGGGTLLSIELTQDTVPAGDTAYFNVMLGDSANPADSVYGLAFTFNYDSTLVDSGTVFVQWDNCWLGQKGVNLLTMSRDFHVVGQTDLAAARTDQVDTTGRGRLCTIGFVTIDNVSGKDLAAKALQVSLNKVKLINSKGLELDHFEEGDSIVVFDDGTSRPVPPAENMVDIYPNPSNGIYRVTSTDLPITGITLIDLTGKAVAHTQYASKQEVQLDATSLSQGIYTLEIELGSTRVRQKVVLLR